MGDLAIRAENLGKRYELGEAAPYTTLKETLAELTRWPRSRSQEHLLVEPSGTGANPANEAERSNRRANRPSDRIWALRGASFEMKTGEVLGIVGRNGAGKSTLLKLLSRITAPTEGRAEIVGRVGSLLEVGAGFHPELTGRENVFLNGAILGMRRAELRLKFDEIVAFAGVERFIDTPVKRYSSGMYTRLAFAIAAHLEPEILIVDEVLAVGDASFQRKCLGKMRDAAGEGRTVLFVSHNMATIHSLTHRCLLLEDGRITINDRPARATAAYLDSVGSADSRRDLADSPRPSWLAHQRAWEFTDVAIQTPADRLGDEPLRVSLSYRCREDVEAVGVRVAICHPNGTFLAVARSADDGTRFDFGAGSEGALRIEIESPRLQPGLYCLALGAETTERRELDFVSEALHFEVLTSAGTRTGPDLAASGGSLGLRLNAHWSQARGDLGREHEPKS